VCELWGQLLEIPAGCISQQELVKGDDHHGAPLAADRLPVRSNADPSDLAIYFVFPGLSADATNTNDRIEIPASHSAHAVVNAKLPVLARVACVSSFVNEGAPRLDVLSDPTDAFSGVASVHGNTVSVWEKISRPRRFVPSSGMGFYSFRVRPMSTFVDGELGQLLLT